MLGPLRRPGGRSIGVATRQSTEIAKRVALSRPVLERRFRKYLGRSPQVEIRRVQIGRAKRLLLEADLQLKSIASLAGFVHPEYLSVLSSAPPVSRPVPTARGGVTAPNG